LWSERLPRAVITGALAAAASALIVGVPTDVIGTPLFTRMTPIRTWEYPVLVLTALLTGAWFGLRAASVHRTGTGAGVFGSSILSTLAVGCPLCNKIVLALLGVSGALGIWAPVQPVLGVLSVAALGLAVLLRWRRGRFPGQKCPVDAAAGARPVGATPPAGA